MPVTEYSEMQRWIIVAYEKAKPVVKEVIETEIAKAILKRVLLLAEAFLLWVVGRVLQIVFEPLLLAMGRALQALLDEALARVKRVVVLSLVVALFGTALWLCSRQSSAA